MSNREQLNRYLGRIEQRLRAGAWSSGIALTTVVLAGATILLVLLIDRFAFSAPSVTGARLLLFLSLAATAILALVIPLRRLNRRFAASRVEGKCPDFQQRLLTFVERNGEASADPFLELLAADTLVVTPKAEPSLLVPSARFAFAAAASLTGIAVFLWLLTAAPGFLGHGAALLWGAGSRADDRPFYDIEVQPGDATVRKGGDQIIQAGLHGFQADNAKLFARFQSSTKWDEAAMSRREKEGGFQFLFAGLAEPVEYYVEAGGIKSRHFKLSVLELPAVKRMRVTYHYPEWTGLKEVVQDQSGDLTAVQGTVAEVAIEFDRPLREGVLALDGSTALQFQRGQGNWVTARVPIQKDGAYHAEAIEAGKNIRISEDFFISASPVAPPAVSVKRPGRDAKVSPIEEVTVEVQAAGDFALQTMDLHYSVNGGPEKTVSLLDKKAQKQASGSTLITLEDFQLVPGDVVSLYASARDARNTARTDMYFLEAQPFEREYTQSQQMGGGGGGGGEGQQQNQISQRQKEIISATWNQSRNTAADRAAAAANAKFLSDVQAKLRDQAKSLAERMRSRELASQNEEFSSFSKDMDAAAEAMGQAAGKLKTQNWKDALPSEQKALQHLLRAEATFREIQVAFGQQGGGGGGGGGGGRDLESLFDLELDTEKNQYETGQQSGANAADQRQKEIDEALQKLEQLARRQQELAAQQAQQRAQSFQQRWQQELLRREAEQLQRQMQQLASGQQGQQQGQQSGQQQSGQQQGGQQQGGQQQGGQQQGGQQQGGQQSGGQQSGQSASARSAAQQRLDQLSGRGQSGQQSANDQRIREAMRRLEQATNDMRRAGENSQNGQSGSDARRAADRLQEARDLVNGLRKQEASGELGDLANRAAQLAARQRGFEERLKNQAAGAGQEGNPTANREQGQQMAAEKAQMLAELERLEKDMQNAARSLSGTQRSAASKVREALGNMQQEELALRMKAAMEFLRRGFGSLQAPREAPVTAGLDRLREQLNAAQGALEQGQGGQNSGQGGDQAGLERGLAQVERLRNDWRDGPGRDSSGREGQPGDGQGREGSWRDGGGGGWDRMGAIRSLNDIWRGGYHDHESRRAIHDVIIEVASRPTQAGAALDRLEAMLRRKLEEKQSGQARTGASDRVPEGYSQAVADYFRRLSKNK